MTSLTALDVWSIGCIFGEFLQMLKENVSNVKERKPMFEGSESDTLQNIFSVIGTPKNMRINMKQSRLKSLFAGSDEKTLDLISNLLLFDSEKRCTINQALKHTYFDCVRDAKLETNNENMSTDLDLTLEFGNSNGNKGGQMRKLILKQVQECSHCKHGRVAQKDVVLMGYIRKYIIPLLFDQNIIQIPKFVHETLCMYISLF